MASDPDPQLDDRPVVAVFRGPVFNPSERFVQVQAASLERYQPLVVGLRHLGNVVPALERRLVLASGRERLAIRLLGRWGSTQDRVRACGPVLVHAHFATDGLAALPLARALGVPLVTSLRGYDVSRSRTALLSSGRLSWMRYALRGRQLKEQGDLFLAVSDALRRRAVALGFPEGRTLTHHNGVDIQQFRPGAGESLPVPGLVLFVGRLVEKKGVAQLLHAFAAVTGAVPEARLRIVGDGPLLPALRRQAERLGLAATVEFAGAMPSAGIAEQMREACLLAAPSLTARDGDAEGLPNSVVEAAASGLPVVATDHAGIPEAVEHNRTGFLVAEGEIEPLACNMIALLQDADLRAGMGRAARKLAEAKFDLRRQMERIEAIYDRLLNGSNASNA